MRLQNSSRGEVHVCESLDELTRHAAGEICKLGASAISHAGRFALALSGGVTPKPVYALLAETPFNQRLDWRKVEVFWTDERCVPADSPDSNFKMANDLLLSRVPVIPDHVHRMCGELESDIAAHQYEKVLRQRFALLESQVPRFDLVLLGMGDDGHTASLFPGSPALNVNDQLVVPGYSERLHSQRLTMTFPVLNAAANIFFLVSGRSKANVLSQLLVGSSEAQSFPVARVSPATGVIRWIVDRAAASALHSDS